MDSENGMMLSLKWVLVIPIIQTSLSYFQIFLLIWAAGSPYIGKTDFALPWHSCVLHKKLIFISVWMAIFFICNITSNFLKNDLKNTASYNSVRSAVFHFMISAVITLQVVHVAADYWLWKHSLLIDCELKPSFCSHPSTWITTHFCTFDLIDIS